MVWDLCFSGSIKQAGRGVWELVAVGLSENLSLKGEEKGIWEKEGFGAFCNLASAQNTDGFLSL